ncbi:beta-galactosidase-like [Hevea brasiliensis]|nr:beta-galactosidase-like [Hevea brasiliensis]
MLLKLMSSRIAMSLFGGRFKAWGGKNPYGTAEDLAFSVARFVQAGGVLNNYYMYHGGTNFGCNAGGPCITTSYDCKAPMDEYSNPQLNLC